MFVMWMGRICAVLSGLLVLAIVATTAWGLTLREGDSGALGVGITFIVLLPMASIPVGIVSLVGTVLSIVALRRDSSPEARTALRLSLAGPVAVLLCYAACFGVLMAAGI